MQKQLLSGHDSSGMPGKLKLKVRDGRAAVEVDKFKVYRGGLHGAAGTRGHSGQLGWTRAGAVAVRVRAPTIAQLSPQPQTPMPMPQPAPFGVGPAATAAYLTVNEMQNLGEEDAELKRLATEGGLDLRMHVQIELGGTPGTPDTIPKINAALQRISSGLRLSVD